MAKLNLPTEYPDGITEETLPNIILILIFIGPCIIVITEE